MKVKLDDVLEAVDLANNDSSYYLDKETISLVLVNEYEVFGPDDMNIDDVEGNTERFVPLPSPFDINDWQTMQNFIWSLPESNEKAILSNDIHRSGAFSRFRTDVERFGLLESWYEYKNEAHREIAVAWCEENGFEWE